MKQLQLKDFIDYQYLSNLQTSPNKKHYSFVVAKANLSSNDYNYNLYLGEQDRQHEILSLKSAAYFWEDDNNILYFNSESDSEKDFTKLNKTIVYRFNHVNKTKEIAYTFDFKVTKIDVLNNNQLLLTASLNEADYQLLENDVKRINYLNSLEENKDYEEIVELPYYFDGGTFLKARRKQLFVYNIESEQLKPLVDKAVSVAITVFNEAKTKLFFTTTTYKNKPSQYNDVYEYDIENDRVTTLYDKHDFGVNKLFVLNKDVYVFGSDKKAYGMNQNPDLYKLVNGELELIVEFGKSTHNSVGSDSRFGSFEETLVYGGKYYFIGTYQDKNILYSFDGQKIVEELALIGSLDTFINYKDEFYGIGLYDNNLPELYKLDLENNSVSKLSEFNDKVLADKYVAEIKHHQFESNNATLDGFVLLPKDYDEAKKYPAILDIHGGPKTIYGHTFFHEMQVWANLGYIVVFTNPHGSDSFDNEFMDIRGKYGTIDYEDIMNFVDEMLNLYAIDEARMGVTGGSYGGFMTNWIVGQTDRFKTAVTQRSISNWLSFYGTSDIGYNFANDQLDLEPIKDYKKAWNHSPLKYVNNVKTPLLVIHSAKDYRCPLEQGLQMFTALKANDVDTKLVIFKEESHGLSRDGKPQARIKRLEEITNWMNKYLMSK